MSRVIIKKPPYANGLRLQGGAVWVFFGSPEGWERAQSQRDRGWYNVLILPKGAQPTNFDWSCIAGFPVVALELEATSPELRHALVRALAVYGAREIYLIPHSRNASDVVMWNCGPDSNRAAA